MSHNPMKDLADYLDTNSTALTIGTNLFYGPVRSSTDGLVPKEAVFVLGTGGPPARRVFTTNTEYRTGTVQITTRSDNFANGLSLAQSIHNTLQSSTVANYQDVRAIQSEPVFLEMDAQVRYFWADNYELQWNSTD